MRRDWQRSLQSQARPQLQQTLVTQKQQLRPPWPEPRLWLQQQ
jgi:hypothetical protein